MAPKKRQAKTIRRKLRSVGLLGLPIYESEEDEDWMPNDHPAAITRYQELSRERGRDAQPLCLGGEADRDNVPYNPRRRKATGQKGDSAVAKADDQANAKRPRRGSRAQPGEPGGRQTQITQKQEQQAQAVKARGLGTAPTRATNRPPAAGRAAATRASRAAAIPAAGAAEGLRDWSGLTEPVLATVFRRACATSAVPTAGSVACVCRHWRQVCKDLEEEAKAAAAAVMSTAMAPVAAVFEAAAAAGLTATTAAATRGFYESGQYKAVGGLWGCLDVRSRPSARFNDEVVRRGLASQRWLQVHTLRLRSCPGLTSDGLVALTSGCPGLTSLDLSQCDSLLKLEPMLAVLSSLPRLRYLDISHISNSNRNLLDSILRMVLAPRPLMLHHYHYHQQQPHQALQAGDQRSDDAVGGRPAPKDGGGDLRATGSAIEPWILPCPLQVLRLRGCPRLGPGTLRALGPAQSHVTLPQPHRLLPSGATAAAAAASDDGGAATAEALLVPQFVHLTELDLTGSGNLVFGCVLAVEKLQAAAPNLRALRLDASGQYSGLDLGPEPDKPGPGFPQLRVCELGLCRAQSTSSLLWRRRGSTASMLRRVVGGSPRLQTLDVSGTLSLEDERLLQETASQAEELDAGLQAEGQPYRDGAADVEVLDSVNPEDDEEQEEAPRLAAAAEIAAVAVYSRLVFGGRGGNDASMMLPIEPEAASQRMTQLMQSLAMALRPALVGPLRVLRASRSLLASDAGLHALAALFGGTLQVVDVSESPNVTDAGLLHLAHSCTALTSLDVSSTAITDFGVRVLMGLRYADPDDSAAEAECPCGATSAAAGTASAGSSMRVPLRGVIIHDLVSDDEEEEEGKEGSGGGRALRHLDISSCRRVERVIRHAAAEGLKTLWQMLSCRG